MDVVSSFVASGATSGTIHLGLVLMARPYPKDAGCCFPSGQEYSCIYTMGLSVLMMFRTITIFPLNYITLPHQEYTHII